MGDWMKNELARSYERADRVLLRARRLVHDLMVNEAVGLARGRFLNRRDDSGNTWRCGEQARRCSRLNAHAGLK